MVDELKTVLQLATEEELQQITNILFCRRLNPLDYWQTPAPFTVQCQDWQDKIDSIEKRFRFLGADGVTVLKKQTQQVSYRSILIQVCRYLKISYSEKMSTIDIETEIFSNLLQKAWQKLPHEEKNSIRNEVIKSLSNTNTPEPLPLKLQHDPLKIILKGSGIIAISGVLKSWLLQQIARQFALHFSRYQVAKTGLIKGGIAITSGIQNQMALQLAKRGMIANTARYTAVRSVFAFLGPVLWASFFADLGWRAIATNYTRIIPVIFTLAQIRLTRENFFPAIN